MRKLAKTIVTVVITMIFLFISSVLGNSSAQIGSALGYIGILLIVGYIAALKGFGRKRMMKNNI